MKLLDAIPKEIHFIMEMTIAEAVSLMVVLDNMQFNYNGQDPTHVEAKRYLEDELYPLLQHLLSEAAKNGIGLDSK